MARKNRHRRKRLQKPKQRNALAVLAWQRSGAGYHKPKKYTRLKSIPEIEEWYLCQDEDDFDEEV